MEIIRIPTHYAVQVTYMEEKDKAYIFDTLMRLSIWEEIELEKSIRWGVVLSIWTEALQLENKAKSKKGKSLKIDVAPMVRPMVQPNLKKSATKSNQIKPNQVNSIQVKPNQNNIISKEIKQEFWDVEINEIIKAIKDNHWTIDWTVKEQRQYWKLLKEKIKQIKWFDWRFYAFVDMLIKQSDEFRIWKTTSTEKLYRNLTDLIANIKAKNKKENEERERKKPLIV